MKIALVIETFDRRIRGGQNYIGTTLQNLTRAGVWQSEHLESVSIVSGGEMADFLDTEIAPFIPAEATVEFVAAPAEGCTRMQNAARSVAQGASKECDYVLRIEDDIDVLDGFLENVVRWLEDYGDSDCPMFSLGASFEAPHISFFQPGETIFGPGWSFPRVRRALEHGRGMLPHKVLGFFGSTALLWRREKALELVQWMGADPFLFDGKEEFRDRGFDLLLQVWGSRAERARFFAVPVPSFVQHIGVASSMGNPEIQWPFPGTNWSYARRPRTFAESVNQGRRRKLLWVGDGGAPSGFAEATHQTLETLRKYYDVAVLAINFRGDGDVAEKYPYRMYPAWVAGGGLLGDKRLSDIIQKENPDVIVLQNDPWNIPAYMKVIDQMIPRPKVVGAIAVDGKNCNSKKLEGLDLAIFWTEFGRDEAVKAGLKCPTAVIPLGVDTDLFCPGDRLAARQALRLPKKVWNSFIIGNVNRNQPRKRMDLSIEIFGKWLKKYNPPDAYLYLHVCPTGDTGFPCDYLGQMEGLGDTPDTSRLILAEPDVWDSPGRDFVVQTLRAFNAQMSTTQGEGMGLTTLEGMACGIPQGPLPDWSALGDWARDAALLVRCTGTATTPVVGVKGGIIDVDMAVEALQMLYTSQTLRDDLIARGLALARSDRFRWDVIGQQFTEQVDRCLLGAD